MFFTKLAQQGASIDTTPIQFEQRYSSQIEQGLMKKGGLRNTEAQQVLQLLFYSLQKQFPSNSIQAEKLLWEKVEQFAEHDLPNIKQKMTQNFGLTEIGFNELLDQLIAGDETIFEQVFLKHFKDCMEYLKRQYKATQQDAYDTSMETMLIFCKRLKEGKIKYGNLRFLFTQMAGQLYLKWIKKEVRNVGIEDFDEPELPKMFDKEVLDILNKAWTHLCQDCSNLLKDFYYNNVQLNEIAEQLNKSSAAVRKQKQRCVEKLRASFNKYYQ